MSFVNFTVKYNLFQIILKRKFIFTHSKKKFDCLVLIFTRPKIILG